MSTPPTYRRLDPAERRDQLLGVVDALLAERGCSADGVDRSVGRGGLKQVSMFVPAATRNGRPGALETFQTNRGGSASQRREASLAERYGCQVT